MPRPPLQLLHCADLHLTHSAWDTSIATLRALGDEVAGRGIEYVLVAGDLFDSSKQPDDFVDAVATEIAAMAALVVAIPGNHDIRYSNWDGDPFGRLFAQLGREAHSITKAGGEELLLANGRMRIWGRGMPEHTPANDPLDGLPELHADESWRIALAHGYLMDAPNGRSSPILPSMHRAALRTFDYVALGHRHSAHQLDFEGTLIADSGSASPLVGRAHYAVVDLREEGVAVEVGQLPIPARGRAW